MTEVVYKIEENRPCARETFCLVLLGDTSAFTAPGQFANLLLPEFFLRRPISVCDVDEGRLTLVYKAVGEGTRALSCLERGDIITALAGLGNGFDISHTSGRPLLVGGGAGAAPMFGLARALAASGRRPRVILGFGSADEIFFEREFGAIDCSLEIATLDGSAGVKGYPTDVIGEQEFGCYFACGPEPMLKAVWASCGEKNGQLSFEERMGCGFGACMGCSRRTKNGYKRVCADGPVFASEEILW